MDQHIIANDELDWLAQLPEFQDTSRPRIRERLEDQLRTWHQEYAHGLAANDHETPSLQSSPLLDESLRRMWSGWRYHWQRVLELSRKNGRTSVAGQQVAESLRAGRRPTNDQQLGGDPLHDCVLAAGVLHGHGGSLARLQEVGHEILGERLRRWRQPLDEALLQDFLIQLGGFDSPRQRTAKLRQFSGYTSLRVWLRRVAHNFLVDAFRGRQTRRERESASGTYRAADESGSVEATVEYALTFRDAARAALASLNPRQQLVLYLKLKQQLPNNQIARLLGVTPPRSSQICRAAERALGQKFCLLAGIDRTSRELSNVLEMSSPLLAYLLLDEIGRATPRHTTLRSIDVPREERKKQKKKGKTRPSKDAKATRSGAGAKTKRTGRKKDELREEHFQFTEPAEENLAGTDFSAGRIGAVLPEAFVHHGSVGTPEFTLDEEEYDAPHMRPRGSEVTLSEDNEETLWRELLPAAGTEVAGVTLDDDPELLFAEQAQRPDEQRVAVLCLDARQASPTAIRDWVQRFMENLDAQPDQPPSNRYEPTLAIVARKPCELGFSQFSQFSDSSEWLDFPMVITDDLARTAVEIYRDDLLAGIRSIVAPPLTEDDRLPDGYETVDAADILSEDELAELHQRQRWSRAIRRRFRQD